MSQEKFFDLSQEYEAMLNQGLRLSGENKRFFMEGRVRDLAANLPADFRPRRILDFGCGIGETSRYLAEIFPDAEVVGVDTSANALEYAKREYPDRRVSFMDLNSLSESNTFDLCYVNGVFHHIPPKDRPEAIRYVHRALAKEGHFALFENNPWNPGTRMVMKRIPFDREANILTFLETRRLLRKGGFRPECTRFLFYFPRALRFLRFAEPWLAGFPLGAQYFVLASKEGEENG